jgi:hypothetical protein
MDIIASKDDLSENDCPDCALYLKEIAELKEAFIEADYESVCRSSQHKDEISYAYRLLEDAKAEIERLKAELSSRSQNKKKVLEEVGRPESNTTLRAPDSLNVTNKEYDTKYRLAEDKHKSFGGDPSEARRI